MTRQTAAWASIALAPLFFVLHEWQRHFGPVGIRHAVAGWSILFSFSMALMGLLWLLFRKRLTVAAAGTLIAFLAFCFWGYFFERVSDWWEPQQPPVTPLLVLFLALVCGLLWWMFMRMSETQRLRLLRFSVLLFGVLALVDGAQVASGYVRARHDFKPLPTPVSKPQAWNFYLLLFDELASPEVLRAMGHDVSRLEEFLKGYGFHIVEHPRSNYNKTVFSMSSILNADFLPGRESGERVDPEEYSQCLRWINNSRLPAAFQKQGYSLINLSIFDLQDSPPIVDKPFFRTGTDLLLSTTFYGRVLRKKINEMGMGKSWQDDPLYKPLLNQETTLKKITVLPPREKRFVYAHFLTPHRPFFFDTTGRLMSKENIRWASLGDEPLYYRASVRHAETVIQRAVSEIMRKEEGRAIVLVIGDHGYRRTEYPGADPVSYQGMAAVYFPDHDYRNLGPGTTHVNVARTAASKTLGIPLPRLPDSCVVLGRNRGRPIVR